MKTVYRARVELPDGPAWFYSLDGDRFIEVADDPEHYTRGAMQNTWVANTGPFEVGQVRHLLAHRRHIETYGTDPVFDTI